MKLPAPFLAALLLLASTPSFAEVQQASPDSFFVTFAVPVAATPAKTYAAITALPHWWSGEHTWSGDAGNLSLKAEAGGCLCERWPGGSAEHGRVIMALPDRLLRIDAALGPLQEFALKGILSFWIRSGDDGATELGVEYRVTGAATSGLDGLAPQVDEMLDVQVARLKRYIETGSADVPVAPPPDPGSIVPPLASMGAPSAPSQAAAAKTTPAKAKPKAAKAKPVPPAADTP